MLIVPLDTHADRLRAVEAIPRTIEYALEGNAFYAGLIYETWVGLSFWAATPWRWLD